MSHTDITRPARMQFATEQVEAIKRTVAKDLDDAEVVMFLEIAARYGLDPFRHEIWAVRMPGRNGARGQIQLIVGRDGLLSIANRSGDFVGLEGDVVRKNDDFKKRSTEGGTIVEHAVSGHPDERGEIVGAWTLVHRRQRRPTYFYAPWSEYVPTSEAKRKYSPWATQPSAMILKCSIVSAMRLSYSLSGLYGEGELDRAMEAAPVSENVTDAGVDFGEDELGERLRLLASAANEAVPGSWRDAKLKARLLDADDSTREALATELHNFAVEHASPAPANQDA